MPPKFSTIELSLLHPIQFDCCNKSMNTLAHTAPAPQTAQPRYKNTNYIANSNRFDSLFLLFLHVLLEYSTFTFCRVTIAIILLLLAWHRIDTNFNFLHFTIFPFVVSFDAQNKFRSTIWLITNHFEQFYFFASFSDIYFTFTESMNETALCSVHCCRHSRFSLWVKNRAQKCQYNARVHCCRCFFYCSFGSFYRYMTRQMHTPSTTFYCLHMYVKCDTYNFFFQMENWYLLDSRRSLLFCMYVKSKIYICR